MRNDFAACAFVALISLSGNSCLAGDVPAHGPGATPREIIDLFNSHVKKPPDAMQLNYEGKCQNDSGFLLMHFPRVEIHDSTDEWGISSEYSGAISNTLNKHGDVAHLNIDSGYEDLGNIVIDDITFSDEARADAILAVLALKEYVSRQSGYSLPVEDISVLPASANGSKPMLPKTMKKKTLSYILNRIERTFGVSLMLGVCPKERIFSINVIN